MYIGIDPGLNNLGYCIINNSFTCIDIGVISPPNDVFFGKRLMTLTDDLVVLLEKYNIEGICAEAPSYGSVNRAYSLGAVHGAIHVEAYKRDIPLLKAAPTQLKKFITGSGRATKEKVKEELNNRYNLKINDSLPLDASDAAALAVISYFFFTTAKASRRCEMETLKKLRIKMHL